MEEASSSFNRLLLNAWIGMSRGVVGLPRVLHVFGYRDVAIEKTITFFTADQRKITICPELILTSSITHNTLILEIKSGKNTEADQLARYSEVTTEVLGRSGFPLSALETCSMVVNGDEKYTTSLQIGIDRGPYNFALIVKTPKGLRLVHNSLHVEDLNNHFTTGLFIDWDTVPNSFIPIDAESALWEVADIVLPHVLALMTKRIPEIQLRDLCARTCEASWSVIGPKGQNDILLKVRKVLLAAATSEYKPFLQIQQNWNTVQIHNNPLEFGATSRSKIFQRFTSLQRRFVNRLRTGSEFKGEDPFTIQEELPLDT
ncbi:hypothetical protein [Longimicrobium sp.]|uniref:hypothetical protein n=1 Tax=Longimicrobium sp. TaxID=2029185 RepID=UPI002D7F783B|nr:hypothetical protein [Longimicrobium sp.]